MDHYDLINNLHTICLWGIDDTDQVSRDTDLSVREIMRAAEEWIANEDAEEVVDRINERRANFRAEQHALQTQ